MEVTDAYQEYVKTRRESRPKNATLTLPESQMASVGDLIADALKENGDGLSEAAQRVWLSILRSVQTSVEQAS